MTSSETTFNDAELILRLRDFDKVTVGDARVAADRIEALEAKVKFMDDLDAINGEKIEALEAKLAKAVEALEFYTGYDDGPIARAALAAIKGESHE